MRKIVAFLALLVPLSWGVQVSAADNYTSLAPTVPVSVGTTATTVSGVAGSCLSFSENAASPLTPTTLLNVDCAGNVGAASFSAANLVSGQCLQAGTNGQLVGVTCPSSGGGLYQAPQAISPSSGTGTYHTYGGGGPAVLPVGMTIGHIYVTCQVYNGTDVTAGYSSYSTVLHAAQTFGGVAFTLAIINSANGYTTPNVLGTATIPTTTYPGPYTSSTSAAVTSYTTQAGDGLGVSTVASSVTQLPRGCYLGVGP
jgi:hypothetical protein